ncbi:MAG: 4-alpha-glucanotransferase [Methanomicrobiales archaeon]|jgi:4-alpha-glucanotransferase|nr:4-alpha-glucanotransferase [Methanomicrobiales archaeon]
MRESGILLPVTALPSPYGVGDLGPAARRFASFLAASGQRYWQVLPISPTSPATGNSPYFSNSAFAGNTLLISPEDLLDSGYITNDDLARVLVSTGARAEYSKAAASRADLFTVAHARFLLGGTDPDFEDFCTQASGWLDDFAHFSAFKDHFGGSAWTTWPAGVRDRDPATICALSIRLSREISREKFLQYLFQRQWDDLLAHCRDLDVRVIGDLPIYLTHDSADVWANPTLFQLDINRSPTAVAGVPPDYFSPTGQLWGNPLYDWESMRKDGFSWWMARIARARALYDLVRLDHFRGFFAYWAIPAGAIDAVHGRWADGPGTLFFEAVQQRFPEFPLIAEDLGVITPDVARALVRLALPGMKVLLFAFSDADPGNLHLPHHHTEKTVVYTGTHDNSPARAWFSREATPAARGFLSRYLGRNITEETVSWEFVRLAMLSVAQMAILPVQDLLALGIEARMNHPGTSWGNWEWRMVEGQIDGMVSERLNDLTWLSGRAQGQIGDSLPHGAERGVVPGF